MTRSRSGKITFEFKGLVIIIEKREEELEKLFKLVTGATIQKYVKGKGEATEK